MKLLLRIGRIVLGVFLLVFGIVALVTPLTPGAWLGLIGLELLGWGFLIPKKIRKLMEKQMQKIPFLRKEDDEQATDSEHPKPGS